MADTSEPILHKPGLASDRQDRTITSLAAWLLQRGLEGATQEELLEGYCVQLVETGVPLARVHVAQSAFHPRYGGLGFEWHDDGGIVSQRYERNDAPPEQWLRSPLFYLLAHGLEEMHLPLTGTDAAARFPLLAELQAAGATDYFAAGMVFEKRDPRVPIDPNKTPEGVLISWSTARKGGFQSSDLDLIRAAMPYLGLALKSASNRQMARELMQVYLGEDAGNRVMSGEIQRGSLQQITAVVCYFDLTGFTQLAERTEGADLIAMLNDYFGLAVEALESRGGHILKFMGDGLLAMFDQPDMTQAASAALDCAAALRRDMATRNAERAAQGLPGTGFTLALHAGEILYGNIGAENRLDFTVIGPAVNLTARLSGMHKPLGQTVIVSDEVRRLAPDSAHDLVSLGRYMMRGVAAPRELYTLYDAQQPRARDL